jgi:SSS family solute:Na+ symporter
MYTDALQGAIMIVGMLILLCYAYANVGGVTSGHQQLSALKDLIPPNLKAIGHQGWTSFPAFGFGDMKYNLWWIMVSTIIMGVGIGVLAQPQLVVRFMTVKSRKELNRAVVLGDLFILLIPGTAYITGALSNVYFHEHGKLLTGKVAKPLDAAKGQYLCTMQKQDPAGNWADVVVKGKPFQAPMETQPLSASAKAGDRVQGKSVAIAYADGDGDQIIPTFITSAMPRWFGLLFLLTLLAAAMSTLSGQYHALGTAISRDVYEQFVRSVPQPGLTRNFLIVRLGILVGIVLATAVAYYLRGDFIARATAIFFGICACTFLPTYVGGLFFKWVTKAGAIASMVVGSVAHITWVVLVKLPEAQAIGFASRFLPKGQFSLLWGHPNWPVVDPLFIGLPLSAITLIVVSLLTKKPNQELLDTCFPTKKA